MKDIKDIMIKLDFKLLLIGLALYVISLFQSVFLIKIDDEFVYKSYFWILSEKSVVMILLMINAVILTRFNDYPTAKNLLNGVALMTFMDYMLLYALELPNLKFPNFTVLTMFRSWNIFELRQIHIVEIQPTSFAIIGLTLLYFHFNLKMKNQLI